MGEYCVLRLDISVSFFRKNSNLMTFSLLPKSYFLKFKLKKDFAFASNLLPSLRHYLTSLMRNILPLLSLILLSLISSCSGPLDAGKINLVNWKSDRYGCKGLRMQELEEFQAIKNNFLGADNQALIKTFGRPDRVDLIDKSQSFFFYFLEPSKGCDGITSEKEPLRVLFRMNALSKVSEVTITTLNP